MHHGAKEETEFFLHLSLLVLFKIFKCQAADLRDALNRVNSSLRWLNKLAYESFDEPFVKDVIVGNPR